jgi:SAM-dependent methyltransferase
MFWPDVVALKEFYASPLGQLACAAVRQHIQKYWPETKDEVLLGVGFASPYLLPYLGAAQRVIACMPAQQGVIHWPPQARNLTLLSDEAELPLPDNSVHRVLIVHAIENSEHVRGMLSEIWRVLVPGGRVLVVAPNRRGIWARAPGSPFAHGQPFTSGQLKELLSEHSFTPLRSASALFFPPSERKYLLRSARFIEKCGKYFFPAFGGLLLLEAEKRIYAPIAQKAHRNVRKAYVPSAQPVRSI